MKVLLFTYLFPNRNFPTNGIYNLSRVKALQKKGVEVCVVAPISLSPHRIYLKSQNRFKSSLAFYKKLKNVPFVDNYNGIDIYYPKWFKLPDKYFWQYKADILKLFIGRKFEKIVNDFSPDLIISSWLNPFGVYSKFLKDKFYIKYFSIFEGSDVLIEPENFKGWSKIEKIINTNCDEKITVSEETLNDVQSKRNISNLRVLNNGFDYDSFKYDKTQKIKSNGRCKIINVAKFNYVKGHDILIEAMRILDDNFELIFVGDGPLLEKSKKLVKRHKLEAKIKFVGALHHSKLKSLLQQQNIFCLPSRSEGLPAAPLEAMSVGLPVVSTEVGAMKSIIKDKFNGLLCKSNSAEEMANKIRESVLIEWDYEAISKYARENYSWDKWAEHIIELYKSPNN